ncbi:MAG: GreA/GreB family elongation factor [Bacteroidota bacterium]
MVTQKNPVIMTRRDYNLLHPLSLEKTAVSDDLSLFAELERSIILTEEAFPAHAIRLNSKVSVLDLTTQEVIDFSIVMPELADSRKNMISILTPMGIALIGFRKAEEVHYRVPSGLKRFRILDVDNRNAGKVA